MACPVAHDKQASPPPGHPELTPTPTDTPNGLTTPGFEPNAPASVVPSNEVTLAALLYESGADGRTVDDWPLPEDLDFSRPVSELLRKGTQRAHVAAEHSAGAVALTNGELELQEYIRWLAILWRVYDALERGLDEHATNQTLAPTYNPSLLARAPELAADITYLLPRLPSYVTKPTSPPLKGTEAVPLPPFKLPPFLEEVFVNTPAPLEVYLGRIRDLSRNADLAPRLLAHAYVRYLGDLSGGQVIGARLRKAYGLTGLDGRRFYYFDLLNDTSAAETGEETVGERKKKLNEVKAWYRRGMDEGAGEDEKLKAAEVREANVAFVLNTHLFSLIQPPSDKKLRYFELRDKENERRANLEKPRRTWWRTIQQTVYFFLALLFGLFLTQIAVPFVAPHIAPHYQQHVQPVVDSTIAPWWNDKVSPWWHNHGWPILEKQMAKSRRSFI
ncbi:Heme oxygenase [Vanrija pseudolonga]|nr:Heme oxygenase [Vanrija pseudolonga]